MTTIYINDVFSLTIHPIGMAILLVVGAYLVIRRYRRKGPGMPPHWLNTKSSREYYKDYKRLRLENNEVNKADTRK
ncbi:hypothetical protein [Spirosoma sp. 209]|uniref:hypothetical protein n=1 Tax=Spirosoma sp. 209 TaxID=1955701 RepID=UPI00098D2E60|nr:hypothetical protein [Spirosoma sp. 209]